SAIPPTVQTIGTADQDCIGPNTVGSDPESLEALDILCAYRPDIHKKDWRGRSVVREAKGREKNAGQPEMREILERHFPDTDFELP
ncbi:hypothetical protein, partial [Comamonas koreensis]